MKTRAGLIFRWLGAAGIELRTPEHGLVIDPYFSRIPWWNIFFGKLRFRPEEVRKRAPAGNSILVTHAHFDHLMDVPAMVAAAGPMIFGSWNTCRLLSRCGVTSDHLREIRGGDRLDLGPFQIQAFKAWHIFMPGFSVYDVPPEKNPPLHARDFRMDGKFAFRIKAGGLRLLTDPGRRFETPVRSDVLFLRPDLSDRQCRALLQNIRPRLVIPIHWESLHRPLNKPLRPAFMPPGWRFPPVGRFNPGRFRKMVEKEGSGVKVLLPEIFQSYELRDIVGFHK
jgi:L-ascorbate metabolism protein UlaG (beta-lactamase superfamily)